MGHWPIESSNLSLSTSEDSNRLSPGGVGSSPWLYIQSEALQGVHGLIDIGSRRVPTFPTAEAKARHRISVTQRLPAVTVGSRVEEGRATAPDQGRSPALFPPVSYTHLRAHETRH